LDVAPDVPLGMFESGHYVEQSAQLLPGDRLVLVGDGLVEATDPVGEEYGEARLQGALLATAALPTGEAVRHMVRTIYQDDELRDNATVFCLDWHGNTTPAESSRRLTQRPGRRSAQRPNLPLRFFPHERGRVGLLLRLLLGLRAGRCRRFLPAGHFGHRGRFLVADLGRRPGTVMA
jgi:hypothetical protein